MTNAKGKEDLKGKNIPLDCFLLHKDQGDGERSLWRRDRNKSTEVRLKRGNEKHRGERERDQRWKETDRGQKQGEKIS